MSTAVHDDIEARLRRDRQRYTAARRQLVDLLLELDRPWSIAELLDGDASLSQSSTYRNLALLEHAGVVRRLAGPDDVARFELAEDVTGDHHHHLVCSSCGRIDDVDVDPDVELAVHDAVEQARTAHGFTTEFHRLELVGTCTDCG